jgi:hypothetical protein
MNEHHDRVRRGRIREIEADVNAPAGAVDVDVAHSMDGFRLAKESGFD